MTINNLLTMAPNQRRVMRKWEIFPGRNRFYCDGYFMTAPNTSVFYLTVVLITGTSTLFFIFDCPFLAEKISIFIPIVGGFLFLFTMCSLLRTTFSDPGILVRASQDEAAYIEKQIEVPNSLNSPTYRPPPRTKEVIVNGQTVKLKYCFTCKIFRPPRASHCSLCDNCVDRFDHHCPWVANCVGKRNYRFFYMFIVSLAFLAVFIFACALTHLVLLQTETRDFLDVIRMSPFSLVVSIICFLSVWSVIGLAGFHTYLTSSNQTTNEDIKGSFSNKGGGGNPYSKGNICFNCFYILCGPLQPSLIDRRGIVTEEYRNQMQYEKSNIQAPPIVVQQLPSHSNDNLKVFNQNETDISSKMANNTLMHGVYRQRSCDNSEKCSSSVVHLVENELPVASGNIQSTSSSTTLDKSVRTSQKNISDLQDVNEIEVVSEKENSLNSNINNNNKNDTPEPYVYFRENAKTCLNVEVESKLEEAPQYSNVPSISPSSNVPIIIKNAAADHVYSNIDETINKNIVVGNRFMSDSIELDLDDPLISSSFIKKTDPQNVYETSSSSIHDGQSSTSKSTGGTQVTSIELKNVLNVVAFQKNNSNIAIKQPASMAPAQLRQDTMIDTALDLDSLDGTGSQVGLM